MHAEVKPLEMNNTWALVDLSPCKVPIGCKWYRHLILQSHFQLTFYKKKKKFRKNIKMEKQKNQEKLNKNGFRKKIKIT